MRDFDYIAPGTLAEAIAILADRDSQAQPLAGGTDLIDQVRTGRSEPALLVDVKRIPELNVLEVTGTGLRLGAAVPCFRISEQVEVRRRYPALIDACSIIGGIQIQSRASVGGNLCNSSPAADSTPPLIAHSATCVIIGPDGQREVPVEEFCAGPGQTVLTRGELLVELRCPLPPAGSASHYRRFIPRNEMDIAVVGVAAYVELGETGGRIASARISLGAVAPTALLAREAGAVLAGAHVSDMTLAQAVDAAKAVVSPIDDKRGTRQFRTHVAGVLVDRVLRESLRRAAATNGT